jgi:hypothetical protein
MHVPSIPGLVALVGVGVFVVAIWRGMRALERIADAASKMVDKTGSQMPPPT